MGAHIDFKGTFHFCHKNLCKLENVHWERVSACIFIRGSRTNTSRHTQQHKRRHAQNKWMGSFNPGDLGARAVRIELSITLNCIQETASIEMIKENYTKLNFNFKFVFG